MGDVPRVELFARQTPPGWDVWGNEVEPTVNLWPQWPEGCGNGGELNMKRFRVLTAALCAAVLLCGLSATAYAGGGEEYPEGLGGYDPAGADGGAAYPHHRARRGPFRGRDLFTTRDLPYDRHTNKQFITVQTEGGSTFYIVIDYDKPVKEDEEQYITCFLSTVDEADLLAAMEAVGMELPACTCTDKCKVGAIDTACPVCAVNMGECAGAEPVPEPVPVPDADPEPEQPEKTGSNMGTLCWRWRWWPSAAGPGGISKSTAPNSSRRSNPRMRANMKAMTIPCLGTRSRILRRKRRTRNELYRQPL